MTSRTELKDIYLQYFPEVYLYLHRFTNNSDEIKDVIQDTFLKYMARNQEHFTVKNVRMYLLLTARNIMINRLRDQNTRRRILQELHDSHPWMVEEVPPEHFRSLVDFTNEAVELLPAACREIFKMAKQDGLSYAQIAEVRGISKKTVEVQMGNALRKIREYVKHKMEEL